MPDGPSSSLRLATDDQEPSTSKASSSSSRQSTIPTARLVIEEPRASDEALYKCDVTYVKGKCPSISLVRVQIMALPTKAQISPFGSLQPASDGQLIGPLNEHDQLKLSCLVKGGRPQPRSVIWRKIDPSGRTINLMNNNKPRLLPDQQAVQVDLNYTLGSSDLGAKFECHVEHEALDQPSTRVVVHNNNPDIAKGQPTLDDSMLDLHPAKPIDFQQPPGEVNGGGKSLDSHILVDLSVGVASVDLFITKLNKRNNSEHLREGDLVELECIAYNSKPPANITWFNGAELIEQLDSSAGPAKSATGTGRHKRLLQRNYAHQNEDGQTFNTHSFLSIKLSRHEHKAQITCQAQNGLMKQPLAKSLELQVQHVPIILMEPASGVVVNEQTSTGGNQDGNNVPAAAEQVTIYCIYSANPTDLLANSTRWFKDGQPLDTSDVARFTETYTATGYPVLTIQQPNRRDAGLYDCQVANSVGFSERLPSGDACRVQVNFRPSVQARLMKPNSADQSLRRSSPFQMDELVQVELEQELVAAGSSYVFLCDILEAQPAKILKFYWFKRPLLPASAKATNSHQQQQQQQLLSITELNQFVLSPVGANFTPAAYSCSASNSLGVSEHSNQIDLQLSYSPGPSVVRAVNDASQRRTIVASGKPAHPVIPSDDSPLTDIFHQQQHQQQAIAVGRELLLECLTSDLGQPKANIWLWFKNGRPIESAPNLISQSSSYNNNNNNPSSPRDLISTDNNDDNGNINNPISGAQQGELLAAIGGQIRRFSNDGVGDPLGPQRPPTTANTIRLLAAGRYLFIPSIQLAHKGNYSCVAVNRLGSGTQQQPQQSGAHSNDREQHQYYQVKVALAPSFVKPLPPRTYWPEKSNEQLPSSLELVCHVQCDPVCQIEWFKNNEPLDTKKQTEFVRYQVNQSIMDENLDLDLFKSVESKLIFEFTGPTNRLKDPNMRALERRLLLSGSNYTCQSSSNTMGPQIRSTTKFVVQYAPENVIINAPSDKLSLIEGSNGPKLICGASGEPQVQYRWFLLKGASAESLTNGIIHNTKDNNNLKRSAESGIAAGSSESTMGIFQSIKATTSSGGGDGEQAINQLANRAFSVQSTPTSALSFTKGANDPVFEIQDSNNLIELTTSATFQAIGSASISTLDLSNVSMDRKQSGHYICEASNKLGQGRQSVYVNIQYKPMCSTLHLHSLDMILAPSVDNLNKDFPQESNYIQIMPDDATSNDEYTILRESDHDYIDLRKMLLISPLIHNKGTSDQLSFKGSIFQTILNSKKETGSRMKIKNALIHSDENIENDSSLDNQNNLLGDNHADSTKVNNPDSWNKFNEILLKYLNNYAKQVKSFEQKMSDNMIRKSSSPSSRQNRRSQTSEMFEHQQESTTKNLITFACLAQDGNPMNNLTFNWSFNSINLTEVQEYDFEGSNSELSPLKFDEKRKPIHLYSNENYTLHVVLVRRLDTRSSLNPFKMSLVTLSVILEPQRVANEAYYASARNVRQMDEVNRTPLVRNRYQSVYSSPSISLKANKNNIQFTQEFYTKSTNPAGGSSISNIRLNEQNWEELIGNLLKCSVANEIGISDVCHVRLNMEERLRSKGLLADSSKAFEFARWGMPSLAQKSLLIFSVLIGFALLIFTASALIFGPYLRGGILMKQTTNNSDDGDTSNKTDSNTGQSTSSQKSSVLGLLGDNSTQGSSDDDSTARMSNQHHRNHRIGTADGLLDVPGLMNSRAITNNYHQQQIMRDTSSNYAAPRSSSAYAAGQQSNQQQPFNERTPDSYLPTSSTYKPYSNTFDAVKEIDVNPLANSSATTQVGSSASRLLANLKIKSLSSRFKVDRISDLTNSFRGNLHTKDLSNAETNTTGLSSSFLDNGAELATASKLISPASSGSSSTFFVDTNLRHSYSGFRQHALTSLRNKPPNRAKPETSYYLFDQNGLHEPPSELRQMMHISQRNNTMTQPPTYLNIKSDISNAINPLDQFIEQREMMAADSEAFYRSRSNRDPSTMFDLNHRTNYHTSRTMNQFQNMTRGPPVYPRSVYSVGIPTINQRPQVAARTKTVNNNDHRYRYSMNPSLQYNNQPTNLGDGFVNQTPFISAISHQNMDTMDSHLNRLTDNLAMSQYQNQEQLTNLTNSGNNNIYNNQQHHDNLGYNSQFSEENLNGTVEHIYDTNAYATPEQTPQRKSSTNKMSGTGRNNARVSRLIESFNSKLPE